MIVGTPYATQAKKKWWKQVIADSSYRGLLSIYTTSGLSFSDKKRVKRNIVSSISFNLKTHKDTMKKSIIYTRTG